MTKSKENLYIQISDSSAIKAIKAKRKIQFWKNKTTRLSDKYNWVDILPSGSKIIALIAIGAHLFSAILAGINIGPILFSVHTNIFGNSTWAEIAKSILPIGMFFFMTLVIGILISKIKAKADPIIPHKYNYNHIALLGAIIVMVIYFGFLLHVVEIGAAKLKAENKEFAQLIINSIIWLSLIELVIGFFAHYGWTIGSHLIRQWWARKRLLHAESTYFKSEQRCERYYQYYIQSSKPDELYMTRNISEVLQENENGEI